MRKWYIVDYTSGDMEAAQIDAETAEEAAEAARAAWDRLTEHDKRRRIAFYACTAEPDEEGQIDHDTERDNIIFK